jgi:hypothetical protein
MSLEQYIRSGSHSTIWIRAVLAFVASVAARGVAPHIQGALDTCATFTDPHQDQRLWFAYRRFQWSSPADSYNGRMPMVLQRQQYARPDESARPTCVGRNDDFDVNLSAGARK